MPKRVGLILTPDNANDRDFWNWCPAGATLHFTRNELTALTDCVNDSADAASDQNLERGTRTFLPIEPAVIVFACTSGSFLGGLRDERRIRATMARAGAPVAITTSGSVLDGLSALGARKVAVGTPYDIACTERLGRFLDEAGFSIVSLSNQPPQEGVGISDMTPAELRDMALRIDRADADALFISCTALRTFELIEPLERELGKPVITAVQATMWAALGVAGVDPPATQQALFRHRWDASTARTS
jgi:maleate isomerase